MKKIKKKILDEKFRETMDLLNEFDLTDNKIYCIPDLHGCPGRITKYQKEIGDVDFALLELTNGTEHDENLYFNYIIKAYKYNKLDMNSFNDRLSASEKEIKTRVNGDDFSMEDMFILSQSKSAGLNLMEYGDLLKTASYPIFYIDSEFLKSEGMKYLSEGLEKITGKSKKNKKDIEHLLMQMFIKFYQKREKYMLIEIIRYLIASNKINDKPSSIILICGAGHIFIFKLFLRNKLNFIIKGTEELNDLLVDHMKKFFSLIGIESEFPKACKEIMEFSDELVEKISNKYKTEKKIILDKDELILLKIRVIAFVSMLLGILEEKILKLDDVETIIYKFCYL